MCPVRTNRHEKNPTAMDKCMLLIAVGLSVCGLPSFIDACMPGDIVWGTWSPCSQSCGGGQQTRIGYTCVHPHPITSENQPCNDVCLNGYPYQSGRCQCSAWRYGECCESCGHISINHCATGHEECGGSPDNIRCTLCENGTHPGGWGKGCI